LIQETSFAKVGENKMLILPKIKATLLILLFAIIGIEASAQRKLAFKVVVEADGGECETNSLHLNQLRRQLLDEEHLVIVIARLGDGESSKTLLKRRLHNARTLLNSDSVIVAEGEHVQGQGRVEFYVDGKPYLLSLVKKGKDICVTCCDPVDNLYPWYKPR
jgi:hypothetical protein